LLCRDALMMPLLPGDVNSLLVPPVPTDDIVDDVNVTLLDAPIPTPPDDALFTSIQPL
jgi:hypothetical protein